MVKLCSLDRRRRRVTEEGEGRRGEVGREGNGSEEEDEYIDRKETRDK